MSKFISFLSFLLCMSAYSFASHASGGNSPDREEVLGRLDAALNALIQFSSQNGPVALPASTPAIVTTSVHFVPQALVPVTTPIHAVSRALQVVGDTYVDGASNLSSTEKILLTQARMVSAGSFVVAIGAAAVKSDIAQKAAMLAVAAKTAEIGYVFWRGYNNRSRQ